MLYINLRFRGIWKKIFRKPAIAIVTLWANYAFNRMRRIADMRHQKEHTMIYVASHPFRPDILTTYDRRRFKIEKDVFGFHARLLTLQTLKNGCYYHTPDKVGNQAMKPRDIEIRRRFFIRERLTLAGLI